MTKREIIETTPGDKRNARRDDESHFTKHQADVGRLRRRPAPEV
jgi:hypothetical protein